MLIYDPALDPYHSAVRILAIAIAATQRKTELTVDAARIADYFLVYPHKLLGFKFPNEYRTLRTAVKATENPYRNTYGSRAAFERMRPIFFAALSGLVGAKLIDVEALKRGILSIIPSSSIPDPLAAAVSRFRDRQTEVGNFVLSELLGLPANGENGLKHRSGLIEYRYDLA
ncbi:ABC-three component system middle component 5 [Achromobacter sp.]|uniref:ABC-three component system middle component 5 n=1 Tax=Achromobacter sp. TaxID=134375 RepID=UPI003C73DA97